jgi:NADH-quinone oxidoreductase subunit H
METAATIFTSDLFRMIVGLIGVMALVAVNALFLIWMERKVSAHMQLRPGPMEVGWHGAIQTVADAIKLMGKELITPAAVDKPIFWLAPSSSSCRCCSPFWSFPFLKP